MSGQSEPGYAHVVYALRPEIDGEWTAVKVRGLLCSDGKRRTFTIADVRAFRDGCSYLGTVRVDGRRVRGLVYEWVDDDGRTQLVLWHLRGPYALNGDLLPDWSPAQSHTFTIIPFADAWGGDTR